MDFSLRWTRKLTGFEMALTETITKDSRISNNDTEHDNGDWVKALCVCAHASPGCLYMFRVFRAPLTMGTVGDYCCVFVCRKPISLRTT